jgi:hypothetical protein
LQVDRAVVQVLHRSLPAQVLHARGRDRPARPQREVHAQPQPPGLVQRDPRPLAKRRRAPLPRVRQQDLLDPGEARGLHPAQLGAQLGRVHRVAGPPPAKQRPEAVRHPLQRARAGGEVVRRRRRGGCRHGHDHQRQRHRQAPNAHAHDPPRRARAPRASMSRDDCPTWIR